MKIKDYIESGILELYVLGDLTEAEVLEVESTIGAHPELKQEIHAIEKALEFYAHAHALEADPTSKPLMLAAANYTDRLNNGEAPVSAPLLGSTSKVEDFKLWLDRPDLQEPSSYDSMAGRIIGSDEEKTTMIVWLKEGAPPEVHTDELEKFLIVEGTCDITIGDTVHHLKAGDFLSIPLFISHAVEVTSSTRCKIILERKAA
jgi:mannose-6-phosphate isomerase-like protein (cupin superfamily)